MRYIIRNFSDLNDSRELYESKPYPMSVYYIYFLFTLIITIILWAYFSEIDIVVKARGVVRPNESISTIVSKSTGKINSINFENGEEIKSGDTLYVINYDNYVIQKNTIEKNISKLTNDKLMAEKFKDSILQDVNLFDENIESERNSYQEYVKFLMDKEQFNENVRIYKEKIYNEKEIINGNQKIYDKIVGGSDKFTSKENDEYYLKYLDYKIKEENLYEEMQKCQDELFIYQNLYQGEVVSEQEIKNKEIAYKNTELSLKQFQNEMKLSLKNIISTSKSQLYEYESGLNKLMPEQSLDDKNGNSFLETEKIISLNKEISEYEMQLIDFKDQLTSIDININNCIIKSPIDGVLNLEDERAIGDFVSEGITLATIIPSSSSSYKVQMYVPNEDISSINIGDKIKYSFDSLPYKEYGMLNGTIKKINADAFVNDSTGLSYYLVESEVENKPLLSYKGKQSNIKVGMSLEGHVISERKRVLYIILEKLDFLS